MAYAAAASLSETIHIILNHHQHSVSPEFGDCITALHEHVIFLRSFLEDCPKEADNWEDRICEVTNVAEDIIELLLSDSLLQSTVTMRPLFDELSLPDPLLVSDELSLPDPLLDLTVGSSESTSTSQFRRLFTCCIAAPEVTTSLLSDELSLPDTLLDSSVGSKEKNELSHDIGELKRIIKEIESIVQGVKDRHKEVVDDSSNDLTQIVSLLSGKAICWEKIIAIVGRGGVGKTTLARNVFNHPRIVEHFEIRAWATVTQDFSWHGVLSSLMRCMNMSNAGDLLKSEYELSESLKRILRHKKCLIVLDDLWSHEVWYKFSSMLSYEALGQSRIVSTTRDRSTVASLYSYRMYIHEMNVMNFDQSWNLLRQKIFKRNPCPPKLEHMGKMIAKSCRGLPLAIMVVSGILAIDQTEAAWEDIAENLKASTDFGDEEHVLHVLYLSYTYLPHYLRPFLLYLGIFSKYHEIRVSKLIKLWVAEGFIGGSYKSLEEMCEEYLEDLVRRSLVFVEKRKSYGRIKSCSIHDLMREMCVKQAEVDDFFHSKGSLPTSQAIKHVRRVSVLDSDLKRANGSTVRTIICLEGNQQRLQQWLGYFRLLRILDLFNAYKLLGEHDFPKKVYELFHLRYLAFDYPFNISKAISNLVNLQILVIYPRKHQRHIVKLPLDIWRMPQLRHLVVVSCELPCQEEAMLPLENLQTLSKAVDLICSRETLKMIANLKKLCITFTSWRDPGEDYDQLHNLIYLRELEVLKIKVSYSVKKLPRIISPPPFHPTLKKLSLKGLKLPWEAMKIVASLPNLQVLKLRKDACIGSTWETSEGGFSQLTFLMIVRSDLEQWITKSSHFPKLKCLVLHHIWRMSGIPHEIGEIQTLELIKVNGLNKALLQSAERIQEDRQSFGNDLQIHVVWDKVHDFT